MARSDPQLNFRCPADLKDRLEAAALRSGRSITMELVARLEESFHVDQRIEAVERREVNLTEVKSMYHSLLERIENMNEYYRIALERTKQDDKQNEMAELREKLDKQNADLIERSKKFE